MGLLDTIKGWFAGGSRESDARDMGGAQDAPPASTMPAAETMPEAGMTPTGMGETSTAGSAMGEPPRASTDMPPAAGERAEDEPGGGPA